MSGECDESVEVVDPQWKEECDEWVEVVDPKWTEELLEVGRTKSYGLFTKSWWVSKQKLGSGAFGKVLWVQRKEPPPTHPCVAKIMECKAKPHRSREADWAREWQIHRMVSGHQNIVDLVDVFFTEPTLIEKGNMALIVQLCERSDLAEFIQHYADVHIQDATLWMLHMCTGLGHLHTHSVMHRDVKPANCMLFHRPGLSPMLKLGDFGHSTLVVKKGENRPHTVPLCHDRTTYRYGAPEVLRNENYDVSADIWGAGVICWEMLQRDPREPAVGIENEDTKDKRIVAVEVFRRQVAAQSDKALHVPLLHLAWSMLQDRFSRPSATSCLKFPVFSPAHPSDTKRTSSPARGGQAALPSPATGGQQAPAGATIEIAPSPASGGEAARAENQVQVTGALPEKVQDALFASKALMPHLHPTDVSVFVEAANSLNEHTGNLLLLFILSMAKYPTAVKELAPKLAKLPAAFTAQHLQAPLAKVLKSCAQRNNSEQLQEEMSRYDEQGMGLSMGLQRMRQMFGLLTEVQDTRPSPSTGGSRKKARAKIKLNRAAGDAGRLYMLGPGRPLLAYKLTGKTEKLAVFVRILGGKKLEVPKTLTTESLLKVSRECFTAMDEAEKECTPRGGGWTKIAPSVRRANEHSPTLRVLLTSTGVHPRKQKRAPA